MMMLIRFDDNVVEVQPKHLYLTELNMKFNIIAVLYKSLSDGFPRNQ